MIPDRQEAFENLVTVARERSLTEEEAAEAMSAMADGAVSAALIRELLVTPALAVSTVSASTLAGLAREVRARAVAIPRRDDGIVVDTCGTGGGAATFNVSTAASILVASARDAVGPSGRAALAVAKHGNRAVASRCGSADVLEELGIRIEWQPSEAAQLLDEIGFAFFFAPAYHRAFAHVMPIRKELAAQGIRTAFNLVGPLANPAGATHQVVGVFAPDRAPIVADALGRLGVAGALVVSGRHEDGGHLDEIATDGPTVACRLEHGRVEAFELTPESFGCRPVPARGLEVEDRAASAALIRAVLSGQAPEAATSAVELNAAAAIATARGISFEEAADLASERIESGAAEATLEAIRVAMPAAR